ncbi:hypothetical protein [Halobacillus sp. Marseille-Q1614]|uniref:hypothetical protein n=1 Tax=Halobacillus sp. Marseille-Q1614 TaxID=2709134 RepID=UPI001571572C|nr:hypothetical protein [Halobacillus sp. Marseille-Q1614]
MKINETYLDFCFIQETTGSLAGDVNNMFKRIFSGQRLNWYMDEKSEDGIEVVVAEVKGMSSWTSVEEVIHHLDENAGEEFWETLQGYQFNVYPAGGCSSCGQRESRRIN